MRLFAAPYLDEGLLVSARLYREIGGHRPLPGIADVDLGRRIGRRRLSFLRSRAVLRGDAPERAGGALPSAARLALMVLRVPPQLIARRAG